VLEIDVNALLTILGAVVWFIIGYLNRQPDEAFEPAKVVRTIIVAIIFAVLIVVFQVPETEAITVLDVLSRVGAIYTLERLWQIIAKRL